MDYNDRTALIVVDVQNDFADPEGALYVQDGERVVEVINREVDRAVSAGALVVYTQDWHNEVTPHFAPHGGTWPVHGVQGKWGAALHPDLEVRGPSVRKGMGDDDGYSGFSEHNLASGLVDQTPLETMLRERRVHKVVVVGLATDYCVRATALDAAARGFEVTVLREAIRAVNLEPGDDAAALRDMEKAGVVAE
ncbi:MAG: isochorismatase family protein [Actinomycetota bacterium]|nr:isochorismatase family protein [Actinomycetota bacterium]